MLTALRVIAIVCSLAILLYALAWDRPGWRGRPSRRCRKCRYDLTDSGDPPVVCPECGRNHNSVRSLRRTRRRWGIALLALIPLAGWHIAGVWPAIQARGWIAAIPDPALIILFRTAPEPPPNAYSRSPFSGQKPQQNLRLQWLTALSEEIDTRLLSEDAAARALLLITGRYDQININEEFDSPWLLANAITLGMDWERAEPAGRGGHTLRELLLLDVLPASVQERLAEDCAHSSIEHRPRWPRDVPLYVRFHTGTPERSAYPVSYGSWMIGRRTDASQWIRWTRSGESEPSAERWTWGFSSNYLHVNYGGQRFPWKDPGVVIGRPEKRIAFDVHRHSQSWEQHRNGTEVPPTDTWQTTIRLDLVDSIDDVITPVEGQHLDDLVAELIQFRADPDHEDSILVPMGYGPWAPLESMALAFRVTFEHHGVPVTNFEHWILPTDDAAHPANGYMGYRVQVPPDVRFAVESIQQRERGWKVIVESNPELALHAFERDRYWKGRVVIDPVNQDWSDARSPRPRHPGKP